MKYKSYRNINEECRQKYDSKGRYIPSAADERAYYESLSYAGQKQYNENASEDRYPTEAEYIEQ